MACSTEQLAKLAPSWRISRNMPGPCRLVPAVAHVLSLVLWPRVRRHLPVRDGAFSLVRAGWGLPQTRRGSAPIAEGVRQPFLRATGTLDGRCHSVPVGVRRGPHAGSATRCWCSSPTTPASCPVTRTRATPSWPLRSDETSRRTELLVSSEAGHWEKQMKPLTGFMGAVGAAVNGAAGPRGGVLESAPIQRPELAVVKPAAASVGHEHRHRCNGPSWVA